MYSELMVQEIHIENISLSSNDLSNGFAQEKESSTLAANPIGKLKKVLHWAFKVLQIEEKWKIKTFSTI